MTHKHDTGKRYEVTAVNAISRQRVVVGWSDDPAARDLVRQINRSTRFFAPEVEDRGLVPREFTARCGKCFTQLRRGKTRCAYCNTTFYADEHADWLLYGAPVRLKDIPPDAVKLLNEDGESPELMGERRAKAAAWLEKWRADHRKETGLRPTVRPLERVKPGLTVEPFEKR